MIPTVSLKLAKEEILALTELYRYNHFAVSSLRPETSNQLASLEARLKPFIDQVGGVAFIKSGRRSCIDCVIKVENRNTRRVWEEFTIEAADDLVVGGAQENIICDATLDAWLQNAYRNLAVTNSFDTMQLMSQSMFACDSLNHPSGPNLYIRQWIEIDPCLQFRVFISKLKITAITQRYALHSQWLSNHAKDVENGLLYFVQDRLLPRVAPLESFCVDLIVRPERKEAFKSTSYHYISYKKAYKPCKEPNYQILLVQFVPFYARSANGFFEWSLDKNILCDGPYEFRYKSSPTSQHLGLQVRYLVGQPLVPKFWLEFAHEAAKQQIRKRSIKFIALAVLMALVLGIILLLS
jgi:hypothetical protein